MISFRATCNVAAQIALSLWAVFQLGCARTPKPFSDEWRQVLKTALENDDGGTVAGLIKSAPLRDRKDLAAFLLISAVEQHKKGIAVRCLEEGADVNYQDPERDSATPLLAAVTKKDVGLTELLLDRGADPNARRTDKEGKQTTILHDAVGLDCPIELIHLLIQRGAQVNAKTSKEIPPIVSAAAVGRLEVVKLLVNAGADVGASSDGFSASQAAEWGCFPDVGDYIRRQERLSGHFASDPWNTQLARQNCAAKRR